MKQTRWLSEFSCLSEYTQLYHFFQDGPGLCFCSEFGVSVWKSDLDRVNTGWVVRSSEKGPGITLVWQVPNSAGSPGNSKPAEPGFSPVPSPSSESKLRTRVRPCSFSEPRTCRARVRLGPFSELRTKIRTPGKSTVLDQTGISCTVSSDMHSSFEYWNMSIQ